MSLQDILARILKTSNPDEEFDPTKLGAVDPASFPQLSGLTPGDSDQQEAPPATPDPTAYKTDLNGPLPTDEAMGSDPFAAMADSGGKPFELGAPNEPPQPEDPTSPVAPEDSAPSAAPKAAPKQAATPAKPESDSSSDMLSTLSTSSNDNDARKALDEKLDKRGKLGNILAGVGGVGDAIENAGASFGGPGAKHDTGKEVRSIVEKGTTGQKADFEKNLQNDPNSDVSRQYQALLAKFWKKDPNDPALRQYSAAQISAQIPAVEKLATIQNQKDMKELQLQYLQNQKESLDQARQDKLIQTRLAAYKAARLKEISNRSGGYGQQDAKVNAAIHARQLIEGNRDPRTGIVHLNQVATPELAMTLANLVSGQTSTSVEQFRAMQPAQLQSVIQNLVGKYTSKPVDVNSPEWTSTLMQMVDRQGLVSERLRDKYTAGIDQMYGHGLPADEVENIKSSDLGSSYSQTFGLDPASVDYHAKGAAAPTGASAPSTGAPTMRWNPATKKVEPI